jgi:predicted nucleotidyltransferase
MNRFLLKKQVLVFLLFLLPINLWPQTFTDSGISLPGVYCSSVAWGDYDNDGYLDILLTGYSSSGQISKIFRNKGDNTFSEQTGIALQGVDYSSVAWGDYDNDGDLDILLTGNTGESRISKIYRNNSDNTFTEQTSIALAEVDNSSVDWGDYDNDGDLDILLTGSSNKGRIAKIYRNDGNNSFTEQTGIALTGVQFSSVAWGDYDNDGNLDIILTGNSDTGPITKIYLNEGDNSFTEQTSIALTGVESSSVAWGDYDNDGDLDILLAGYSGSGWTSKIFRNNSDNTFTKQSVISLPGVNNGSVAWGDYDNDGDLDIILTGFTGSERITKIYINEAEIPNVKPAIPSNLQVMANNEIVTFTWDKPFDTETPRNGLSYNIYIYENGQSYYECPPHAFKQTDINNGRRLIAKSGIIQWSSGGYKIKDLPPDKTYYWTVQAVDAGFLGGSFSVEQNFAMPFYRPVTQANTIIFSNKLATQAIASWAIGGGTKRAVFIKTAITGKSDPVDNTTYEVNEITPEGWKCVYNGTGNSVVVTGLVPNTDYLLHVCEYNGAPGNENYLKSEAYQNPAKLEIIFIEQTGISLANVNASSVAWGDYNNDGDLDILLTGFSSTGYTSKIYRNDGDNIFTELTNIVLTGVESSSVAWGDYDNDGDLDILLTGFSSSGYISKIYRNDGGNIFTEQTGIALTGVEKSSVAWGDYDNDGDLDILLTGHASSEKISKIYRNNSNNSFTEQPGIAFQGVDFGSVDWGDYDNDGDLDIMLTGASENKISKIYRNNGDNTFTEQTGIALAEVDNSSVDWGDYDNDGDLDILLTGSSNKGRIAKIYRNDGNNGFTEQTGIALTGVEYSSVAWGDYDNDGNLDILLTGTADGSWSGNVSKIYHNNGDNSFTEQTSIELTGVAGSSVAWADYDNDGDLDILLTGNSSSGSISKIYRNEILNQNIIPSVPAGLQSYWDNDSIIFKWNKSSDNTTPTKAISYNLRIGTSPGGNEVKSGQALPDGKLLLPNINNVINDTCIILKLPLNKYYWSVQAIDKGGLASNFAPEEITPLDSIQTKDLQAFIKPGNSMLIRWKKGNGLRRALFGRLSSPSGRAKPVNGTIYHAEPYFSLGDQIGTSGWNCIYNGKADTAIIYGLDEGYSYDIQVVEYIEINGLPVYFNTVGNGNPGVFSISLFSEQTSIELPVINGVGSIAWGDYDNDGDLDILLTGYNNSYQTISKIYRNNGNNSFTEQTGIALTGVCGGSVAWGDYDNDDDLDILLTGLNSSNQCISKIYRNNGDNTFIEQTGIVLAGIYDGSVAWGDYDNDGNLDIILTGVTVYPGGVPVSKIYHNNGDNSFAEQTSIELTGVLYSSVAWGDYDNDGDLDILLTGYNNSYQTISKIYRNNGNNSFTEQTSIALTGIVSGSVAWGDFDNDNDLDILLSGSPDPDSASISKIYCNNGNNSFTEQTGVDLMGVSFSSIALGDYDNDGDLDIILTGSSDSGYISKIYHNNGNNNFTEQNGVILIGVVGSTALGDYDNDGDLDFLLIGSSNNGAISKIYRNNTFMKAGDYSANRKPEAPDGLSATAQPCGIYLDFQSHDLQYQSWYNGWRIKYFTGSIRSAYWLPSDCSNGERSIRYYFSY